MIRFADLVDEVLAAAAAESRRRGRLTYGEVWMALLARLRAKPVDVAVIEVGAGGRFDLTNVVTPAVSVITSVGLDHTETLGATIAEIAWHKAGIIKPGAPVVTAVADPEALAPILARRSAVGTSLTRPVLGIDFAPVVPRMTGRRGFACAIRRAVSGGDEGRYQATNAALAIEAVRALQPAGFEVSEEAIEAGLAGARLPGRFETVQEAPRVMLDGAHNLQKIGALMADLPELLRRPAGARLIGVLGVLEAKDHAGIVERVVRGSMNWWATRPRVLAKPGADPVAIAAAARRAGSAGRSWWRRSRGRRSRRRSGGRRRGGATWCW